MQVRHALMTAAAVGLLTASAHAQTPAQSPAELLKAAEQAMQAAKEAMKAAKEAQAAAEQAQAALAQAQQAASAANKSVASATISTEATGGEGTGGLTYRNGPNTVSLYGLIDITLSNRNNVDTARHSQTGFQTAWFSGNRWGITGKHAMGQSGLSAIFKLESEFDYQDGSMDTANVLFNRDAWLGLESDDLGKLTFGRQNTLARDFSGAYGDPYGNAKVGLDEGGWTNNNNFKQMIFYAGSATGTRYDRGVVWKKKFDKVVAGLGFQFGGVPGDFNQGSTKSAALAYNGEAYTVSGFINSANVAGLTKQTASIGGNYQVNPLLRLNAGYFRYTADQAAGLGSRKDNGVTVSAKLTPKGLFDYELGYQVMSANGAAVNGAGYVYNAYANDSAAKATATGKRNTLYGSVFYHFDKQTEVYLAFDRLNTTGGYLASQANGARSQNEFGLGMRYKF